MGKCDVSALSPWQQSPAPAEAGQVCGRGGRLPRPCAGASPALHRAETPRLSAPCRVGGERQDWKRVQTVYLGFCKAGAGLFSNPRFRLFSFWKSWSMLVFYSSAFLEGL